jgi:hypothetical protein
MKIDRRHFIKNALAAGAFMAGGGAVLSSCSGIRRADLPVSNSTPGADGKLDHTGWAILEYAAMAPSGHNAQPWTVKVVNKREWIVGVDPGRRLPVVDPNNRETLLSIGTFAENLFLAAGHYGLGADMEVLAGNYFDEDILKVKLQKSRKTDYPMARIKLRRTVKHHLLPNQIKSRDVRALGKHLNGHLHYFPADSEHGKCIRDSAVENFRKQSMRDEAQKELVKWLRLSNAQAKKFRDGLTTEGMEITGIKGLFVRHFVSPEDFLKPDYRRQGVDMTAKLAAQGGGWLIITSPGKSVADLIDTGRRFQQMALTAREKMIALHPMTQTLEEESGQKEIAANHPSRIVPQFILRVGYLKSYPDPVSLRRPVAWFVRS